MIVTYTINAVLLEKTKWENRNLEVGERDGPGMAVTSEGQGHSSDYLSSEFLSTTSNRRVRGKRRMLSLTLLLQLYIVEKVRDPFKKPIKAILTV